MGIGRNTVTLLSNNQLGVEGHKFLRILLTKKPEVLNVNEIYQLYSNKMIKPCIESMESLTLLMTIFPVKEQALGGVKDKVSRIHLLSWIKYDHETGFIREQHGCEMSNFLIKLVTKSSSGSSAEYSEPTIPLNMSVLDCFESKLNEAICMERSENDVNTENTVESVIPVSLPDMIEAVQEYLVHEAGELLEKLNGSWSAKSIESILILTRTILSYLSKLIEKKVIVWSEQNNIVNKLLSVSSHMLLKASEATVKV